MRQRRSEHSSQRVEQIYALAKQQPPNQRAAFLAQVCGEKEEVRREVEALLAEDAISGDATERQDSTVLMEYSSTLNPGTQLGPYEITRILGAGGMGRVYSARDIRLGRSVAIKVCSEEFIHRFKHEARAISALNHPHICTLYDVGPNYLVMELVQGETLAAVLAQGALPVDLVLLYAAQIADALAAAHSEHIIHRDLKPGNLIVSKTGIKVLDFGLARFVRPSGPQSVEFETVTASHAIMGTIPYMPPEQLEGRECDTRTDIFALGLIMYEMATGKRAFQGDSQAALIGEIMRCEPMPPSRLIDGISSNLENIIIRCLQKDPNRRFQNMADLRATILGARDHTTFRSSSKPLGIKITGRSLALLVSALTLVLLIGGAVWWVKRPKPSFTSPVPVALTNDSGVTFFPALSRDAKLMAYSSDRADENNLDIWVQQVPRGQPIRLTHHEAIDNEPDFSPDGTQIVFGSTRGGGGIDLIPTLSPGEERKIADGQRFPRFSPNGKWISYQSGDDGPQARTFIVPASGGQPRPVQPDFERAMHPLWAPDSKHILFGSFQPTNPPSTPAWDWWVAPIDGGPAIKTGIYGALRAQGVRITNASDWFDGYFYLSGGTDERMNIWRVPISPSTFQATGPPERVTLGAGRDLFSRAGAGGQLVFAGFSINVNLWSLPLRANLGKAAGVPEQMTRDAGEGRIFAEGRRVCVSPDGTHIAFASARSGSVDVWMEDLQTKKVSAIVATPETDVPIKFSRNGSRIIYSTVSDAKPELLEVDVGGGAPRRLCECRTSDVSPDDSKALTHNAAGKITGASLLDIETGTRAELLKSKYLLEDFRFSPDGRWIAFRAETSAPRGRLYIIPVRGSEPSVSEREWIDVLEQESTDYGPQWSPDGNLLYFVSARDGNQCVWAQRLTPATKRPRGTAFAALHQHVPSRRLYFGTGIGIGLDRLFVRLSETKSNIWMLNVLPQ
jgi:serine/threonine protein kinase